MRMEWQKSQTYFSSACHFWNSKRGSPVAEWMKREETTLIKCTYKCEHMCLKQEFLHIYLWSSVSSKLCKSSWKQKGHTVGGRFYSVCLVSQSTVIHCISIKSHVYDIMLLLSNSIQFHTHDASLNHLMTSKIKSQTTNYCFHVFTNFGASDQ